MKLRTAFLSDKSFYTLTYNKLSFQLVPKSFLFANIDAN